MKQTPRHNMDHIFNRMDKVSIGKYTKLDVLNDWMKEYNLNYSNIAYIGDDIHDLEILNKVAFSACPSNAVKEVKNIVDYVCHNKGGDGAVREFINKIIN